MTLARPALIKAALGAGGLLAVTALAAAFVAIGGLVENAKIAERAVAVLGRVEAVREGLASVQALQQRYLTTADEQVAGDYRARKSAIALEAAEMERLAFAGEQKRRARALAEAVGRFFTLLDETIERRRRNVAPRFSSGDRIVAATDEVRRIAAEIIERGRTLQLERRAQAQSEVRFTVALVAVAGAFALALFATAALLLGRFQRQRDSALAELAALEHRLEMAVSGSELAVWDWDRTSDTVYLSEAWSRIVGGPLRATTTTADALVALVHPEDLDRLKLAFAAMNDGGQDSYRVEHRVRAEDGSYRWINSRGKVVARDARGRVVRVTGTNADISARKRAELALAASERELRLMADAVPAMIAYVDAGECYRFYNRAFERWLGVAASDGYGRTVREVTGAERYAGIEPYLRRALAGEEVRFERGETLPDGRKLDLAAACVPHRAQDGAVLGVYALLTDITALKLLDRLKSEFVTNMGHELRTPMTAIRGSLGLLRAGAAGALPESAAKLVGIAESACERLVRLVDDIVVMDQVLSDKLEFRLAECDLVALARQALDASEAQARARGVSLRLGRTPAHARVTADPGRVNQVLVNLITNATQFSPAGASVELDVESGAGRHRVAVRDHGPGVAAEFRPRLFEKFSQANTSNSRATGGAGLGLAISKSIIERMGGRIGYEPATGGGAVFFFDLPGILDHDRQASISPTELPAEPVARARSGAVGGGG